MFHLVAGCVWITDEDLALRLDTGVPAADTDSGEPDTDSGDTDTDSGEPDTDSGEPDTGDTDSGDTDSGDTDTGDTDSGDTAVDCDLDDDGYCSGDDCDDTDPNVHPAAVEICNDVDDDCDGAIDADAADASTFYADDDGDGFGGASVVACELPAGNVENDDDCDDTDPNVNPDAVEVCNGADDDCDGDTDATAIDRPTWYEDADGDGFGSAPTLACDAPPAHVATDGDCDDTDPDVNPDAAEVCNDLDDDCDGDTDTTAIDRPTWYDDDDGDGFGSGATVACDAPAGHIATDGDCDDTDDTINPDAADICDGIDTDCDGYEDGPLGVPSAMATLQDAVDAAVDGDTICIEAGRYLESVDLGDKSITLEGAGSATTIIDADGSGRPLTSGDTTFSASPTLRGLTLTGGDESEGGGAYLRADLVTMEDVVVEGNDCVGHSACYGTGIYLYADADFTDVVVRDNYAATTGSKSYIYGAGVYLYGTSGTFTRLEVSENVADLSSVTAKAFAIGGGISMTGADVELTDVEVTDNTIEHSASGLGYGDGQGAGIAAISSELDVAGLLVAGNTLDLPGAADVAQAAGIFLSDTEGDFAHTEISDNVATSASVFSSALYLYSGSLVTFTNAVIANNEASASGSGLGTVLLSGSSSAMFVNVDVAGNDVGAKVQASGGGFYLSDSAALTLLNTIIYANSVSGVSATGGAIYLSSSSAGVSMSYCDVYKNTSSEFYGMSSTVGLSGNIAGDPQYTDITAAEAVDWDLTLGRGSVCVNSGSPSITDVDGSRSDMGGLGGPGGGW